MSDLIESLHTWHSKVQCLKTNEDWTPLDRRARFSFASYHRYGFWHDGLREACKHLRKHLLPFQYLLKLHLGECLGHSPYASPNSLFRVHFSSLWRCICQKYLYIPFLLSANNQTVEYPHECLDLNKCRSDSEHRSMAVRRTPHWQGSRRKFKYERVWESNRIAVYKPTVALRLLVNNNWITKCDWMSFFCK